MRIGLVSVDKTSFPNLALAKISAYHKAQGDDVEWADPMFGEHDRVYASKIFTFSPDDNTPWNCEVIRGGTGYSIAKELPSEIDRLQPDYSIYPNIDEKTSYGFITRGCPNKCSFCIVPKKEGGVKPYMDVDEITQDGRRPKIIALDNNILASDYGLEQIEKIVRQGYRVDFTQAIDSRLVTPDIAQLLAQVRWLAPIKFGCDSPKQVVTCEKAMSLIDSFCKTPRSYLLFTIIMGDIQECYERISHFKSFRRVRVHAQPMREFDNPCQIIPQWQKDMARWADRKEFYRSIDFKEFEPRKGFRCGEYFKR